MNFLQDIKNSFYNPAFYATLPEKTLGFSFKYFFSLIAILAFLVAFVLGSRFSPFFSTENLKKLAVKFPAELTLTLSKGVVSTNVSEPYMIKGFEGKGSPEYANFIVIDTKNDFSSELFKRYDTSILIGKNFFVNVKSRSQFQYNDLGRAPDITLNQERLLSWAETIGSHHLALSLGFFVILFLAFFVFFSTRLVWLLVLALIIMLLAKLRKVTLSYKDSYKFAIQAGTAPFMIEAIFIMIGVSLPVPFLLSLVLLLVAFINMDRFQTPLSFPNSTPNSTL